MISPSYSPEIQGGDYLDHGSHQDEEADNSNSRSTNGTGNTSNSYEAPIEERDSVIDQERERKNEDRTLRRSPSKTSSIRTGESQFSGQTSNNSHTRRGEEDESPMNTPFSRVSELSKESGLTSGSPASSVLPELEGSNYNGYGYGRNLMEGDYGSNSSKIHSLSLPPASNNSIRHGTSVSSLSRTAILNQSQASLSPRKSTFQLSPTRPNRTLSGGKSPPPSPSKRPPSSPGRMNGNSGPMMNQSIRSYSNRPATATLGSASISSNSFLGLQVGPNHPYAGVIEAGLPPTLSAENLVRRETSMSSNSNSTSSTNGGGLTKRLRAVSTSSRLKVLPSWFSSSKDSRDSKDGKELGYENGMLHCDSPTHLTASGASSVHSSSTSNTPRSPMSMNRIPPPLNHLPQSSNQSQMTRNRPVSEQRSPPPKTKGSDSFSSSDMNRTLISSNTATLDGVSGPLGRFRSRTLGSADRRPSSSNSNVLPPSPSNLISKLPSSYPPSSSKSSSANLKALRRPSKTDTLSSSINGGGPPSISLSNSERGSGIYGYESSGGGSSKRNSNSKAQSIHSHSNSNSNSNSQILSKPSNSGKSPSASRPKSKGGWASHLTAGLTLHLSMENLDGSSNTSKNCQVTMNYMLYDPFGKPESLVPEGQFGRPVTPKKSKSRGGDKDTEPEEKEEDTSGVLEFSPAPFDPHFSESSEFCFPMNSNLVLKHLTVGNDLKSGDLISRQATISLSHLGTHSVSGLERKGKLAWRFIYSVEDRAVLIENDFNDGSGLEKVPIKGERKLRPISFECSSTLLDPSRARKSRLITMVKKSVGSQITSTQIFSNGNGNASFDSPNSSRADLSLGNQSIGSLSIPPSPSYSSQQAQQTSRQAPSRQPSDSSLNNQAHQTRRALQQSNSFTASSTWAPPANLVPFRMTRPSVATSNGTAYTNSSGFGAPSTRSSAASQNQLHGQNSGHHQPLPSPSRSIHPPSSSKPVTRKRGASLGEASRANPVGLLNDSDSEKNRSVSGNIRTRPSMSRRITPERELPTLPASSSSGHYDQTARHVDRPPTSPVKGRFNHPPDEDYGVSPKSVPAALPRKRERDPNRPPTASEAIKLEYQARESSSEGNGRFVSNGQPIDDDDSLERVVHKSHSNSQLRSSFMSTSKRERSRTAEGGGEFRSSESSGRLNNFSNQPFDLEEMTSSRSGSSKTSFNSRIHQQPQLRKDGNSNRPSTALATPSPSRSEFFQQPDQRHSISQTPSKKSNLLLAPFQMKDKNSNSSSTTSNQQELKKKSSFKSFTSSKKRQTRARTATNLGPEEGQKTGALLVELGWI